MVEVDVMEVIVLTNRMVLKTMMTGIQKINMGKYQNNIEKL